MNNINAKKILDDCDYEIKQAISVIEKLVPLDKDAVLYINRYAIIRTYGAIEMSLKNIITDFCINNSSNQELKKYFDNKIKNKAMNIKYEEVCKLLKLFNENWKIQFKNDMNYLGLKKIRDNIELLVDNRHLFAHGTNITIPIETTYSYFTESRKMIEILDKIII